ncbi:hypothetical protein [Burkholderia sp. Bp9143]|nr:hypothetical protein [Burkholderia sp. Bp9143]
MNAAFQTSQARIDRLGRQLDADPPVIVWLMIVDDSVKKISS